MFRYATGRYIHVQLIGHARSLYVREIVAEVSSNPLPAPQAGGSLYRDILARHRADNSSRANSVGLCTLNQVDPYPIAYNLSNP